MVKWVTHIQSKKHQKKFLFILTKSAETADYFWENCGNVPGIYPGKIRDHIPRKGIVLYDWVKKTFDIETEDIGDEGGEYFSGLVTYTRENFGIIDEKTVFDKSILGPLVLKVGDKVKGKRVKSVGSPFDYEALSVKLQASLLKAEDPSASRPQDPVYPPKFDPFEELVDPDETSITQFSQGSPKKLPFSVNPLRLDQKEPKQMQFSNIGSKNAHFGQTLKPSNFNPSPKIMPPWSQGSHPKSFYDRKAIQPETEITGFQIPNSAPFEPSVKEQDFVDPYSTETALTFRNLVAESFTSYRKPQVGEVLMNMQKEMAPKFNKQLHVQQREEPSRAFEALQVIDYGHTKQQKHDTSELRKIPIQIDYGHSKKPVSGIPPLLDIPPQSKITFDYEHSAKKAPQIKSTPAENFPASFISQTESTMSYGDQSRMETVTGPNHPMVNFSSDNLKNLLQTLKEVEKKVKQKNPDHSQNIRRPENELNYGHSLLRNQERPHFGHTAENNRTGFAEGAENESYFEHTSTIVGLESEVKDYGHHSKSNINTEHFFMNKEANMGNHAIHPELQDNDSWAFSKNPPWFSEDANANLPSHSDTSVFGSASIKADNTLIPEAPWNQHKSKIDPLEHDHASIKHPWEFKEENNATGEIPRQSLIFDSRTVVKRKDNRQQLTVTSPPWKNSSYNVKEKPDRSRDAQSSIIVPEIIEERAPWNQRKVNDVSSGKNNNFEKPYENSKSNGQDKHRSSRGSKRSHSPEKGSSQDQSRKRININRDKDRNDNSRFEKDSKKVSSKDYKKDRSREPTTKTQSKDNLAPWEQKRREPQANSSGDAPHKAPRLSGTDSMRKSLKSEDLRHEIVALQNEKVKFIQSTDPGVKKDTRKELDGIAETIKSFIVATEKFFEAGGSHLNYHQLSGEVRSIVDECQRKTGERNEQNVISTVHLLLAFDPIVLQVMTQYTTATLRQLVSPQNRMQELALEILYASYRRLARLQETATNTE